MIAAEIKSLVDVSPVQTERVGLVTIQAGEVVIDADGSLEQHLRQWESQEGLTAADGEPWVTALVEEWGSTYLWAEETSTTKLAGLE